MSWQVHVPRAGSIEELRVAADAAFARRTAGSPHLATEHNADQLDAALDAIAGLADLVGGWPLEVIVGGHSNPDRTPRHGYARDQLHISVSHAGEPVAPEVETWPEPIVQGPVPDVLAPPTEGDEPVGTVVSATPIEP